MFLSTRDPSIDIMKGVGMLLVIMSHLQLSLPTLGYSIIGYSAMFMMPMFFFVSGYVYPFSSDEKSGFGRFLFKKVVTLLLPYVIFFGISLLWTETVYATATGGDLFGFRFTAMELVRALLLAGEYLYNFATVPFPIWFLHALFFASILFYFLAKIKSKLALAGIAAVLFLASRPLQTAMADSPLWLVRLLPLAVGYMLAGFLARHFMEIPARPDALQRLGKNRLAMAGFAALACFVLGTYCLRLGGGDMWSIASYWHIPGAFVSILGCWLFAKCTQNDLLRFVGTTSLLYLGLHTLIIRLPQSTQVAAWFEAQGFDGILVYIGYYVVNLFAITVLVLIARFIQNRARRLYRK